MISIVFADFPGAFALQNHPEPCKKSVCALPQVGVPESTCVFSAGITFPGRPAYSADLLESELAGQVGVVHSTVHKNEGGVGDRSPSCQLR